jgi:hypothetical protein
MEQEFYTGVGSRETPGPICLFMTRLAIQLEIDNWRLRSGAAPGADEAFEAGVKESKDIYVPWNGFQSKRLIHPLKQEAYEIAMKLHPNWGACSEAARKLHTRNVYQVLGHELNKPSKFLVCWTPDGCIDHKSRSRTTGGTGTAISIANHYNVPVFNLARPEHYKRLNDYLVSRKAALKQ